MKWPYKFTEKSAIVCASVILISYLMLILTVTSIGQKKLKQSKHTEVESQVHHNAELIAQYFDNANERLQAIAKDTSVTTFFANKRSGMSITYGLGASLFNLNESLKQPIFASQRNPRPIFSRLTILALDGEIIADSDPGKALNIEALKKESELQNNNNIHISAKQDKLTIHLLDSISFQNESIATVVAEINNDSLVNHVMRAVYPGKLSHLEINTQYGHLLLMDKVKHDHTFTDIHPHDSHRHDTLITKHIEGTEFTLFSYFEKQRQQDFITSNGFLLILSLLAIPVFWGLYYVLNIERKNARLQTSMDYAKQQQSMLLAHNEKLKNEIEKRKTSEKKLVYQATHDRLTGLPNRSYSLQRLEYAIETATRSNKKILVMAIDLDNFKQLNDTLGYDAGDTLLQAVSKRLVNTLRKTDTVAHLGGDEFMLITPELPSIEEASALAIKILNLLKLPFQVGDYPFHTTTSIGLALFPENGTDAATLLKNASIALYTVKNVGAGSNNFSFYDAKINEAIHRKVNVDRRLRVAIEENTLEMYYQPLVDLQTHKIIGAEALMRWTDAELGFVSPEEFIGIAEKNNLMSQLGSFALKNAAKTAAKWQAITPLTIAINFSSVQFRDCQKLLKEIREVLAETGLPADKLDVEVTESLLINQANELLEMIHSLREINIQLSIDDFGTGYSALSYLQKFSFTKLKIDRAFIMNLMSNKSDQSLVTAIVAMAKALNLKVVAEGIEEEAQAEFLSALECEYAQGYLFSKPLPADQFEALLHAQNTTL